MTPITRRLTRITPAAIFSQGRKRPIAVELAPDRQGLIGFRLKGMRTTYYLPVDWCFREALKAELARRRAERKKARGRHG